MNKQENAVKSKADKRPRIEYPELFWLMIAGSLIGIVLEGVWNVIIFKKWETHVVTVWEPLCLLYGIGAVICYIGAVCLKSRRMVVKFIVFSFLGTALELITGFMLEYGLHMRAWNYSKSFMNYRGYICLQMTIMWGILGIGFTYLIPSIDRIYEKMQGRAWKTACMLLTIFFIIDIMVTAACFLRWKDRHEGFMPKNRIEQMIDNKYNDAWMAKRFCEWKFID